MSNRKKDLTGEIVGRFKILYEFEEDGEDKVLCVCKCGNTVEQTRKQLSKHKNRGCEECGFKVDHRRKDSHTNILSPEQNYIWHTYKGGAKQRGILFDLSPEIFLKLILGECYYCGTKPNEFNGIDRVDSSEGYTVENCVTCCTTCNRMKSALSEKVFMQKIREIYENRYKNILKS